MNDSETNLPRCCGTAPIDVELAAGTHYAYCTCGLSAIQPFCDGSHRGTDFRPIKFTAEVTETVSLCLCKRTGNAPRCDGTHARLD